MAKKKSGYSKKSKDWLGRTVINHYNEKGKKTGYSKPGKDFWGNPVTERFNAKGEKKGYNKPAKTFWGNDVTERFNSKGEKVGYNKKGRTFWGTPVTERYNAEGEKTGHSVRANTFWGTPTTQHYDDTSSPSYAQRHGDSDDSADYGSVRDFVPPRSSSSGWLWLVGIVIVAGIVLRSGVLDSLIVGRTTLPVASDAPPTGKSGVPQPLKSYEPTKVIGRDAQTGLITIDATADEIGTAERGWFTVITGGMNQQIFLRKEYPDIDVGDRLRITYDEHLPEQIQGPPGTAAYLSGVIVSMAIVRHEDSPGRADEIRIENNRLLPVDGGVEDASLAEFRQDLIAAISRKDSRFLLSVLAPDIKVGFGSEPDNSSEFERVWNIESPDSPIWTELDKVLKLGGRFETLNGKRIFCAPYLCGTWPQNFDPFSYVAVTANSVQLHSSADDNSPSLANLSYNVLHFVDWTQDRQWAHVTTTDGFDGFVKAECVRSPLNYRATFETLNGKWVLAAFVAGD